MMLKNTLLIFITLLFSNSIFASDYLPWNEIEQRFSKVSNNLKALGHVRCFLENYKYERFHLKAPEIDAYTNRCYANPLIKLGNDRFFAIIDYTVNSDQKRMFIIDRKTGDILSMAVAHGRYKAGFFNLIMDVNKNTIKEIKYYSNTINSMASSSGFFIAGQDFMASDFGRSLVIHGLESGINDNACVRDVVIHSHFLVSNNKAYVLSSGCPMVSPSNIDNVIDHLKGKTDDDLRLKAGGSLVFIYGPREAAWDENSCPGNFRMR